MKSSIFTPELIREYINANIWDSSSLASICDENARKFPIKEALADSKSRLTWQDVKDQTDHLAMGLINMGLTRDEILVTQLPTCAELYLLIVAGQKCGVVIATVSPNFREASIEPILQYIKPKAAVIPWRYRHHNFYDMYAKLKMRIPTLDQIIVTGDPVPEDGKAIPFRALSNASLKSSAQIDLSAYSVKSYEVNRIGTTSGSTGIPKLYEVIECSRMVMGKDIIKRWHVTERDTIGAFYPITGGGLTTLALIVAPMTGAKVALCEHFSPEQFCKTVEREKVTIACVVPTEMARIMEYADLDNYDLSSLRLLANSTDILPYELGRRAEEKFDCQYVNTYGATDAGGLCCSSVSDSREVRLRTVGRPYEHSVVRIVDDDGNQLPSGELGNVMIRINPCSASGYYKNPELNKALWGTSWFSLCETGMFDDDGNLILASRKRNVIKRGGQRISPKDIENFILRHPDVAEVAVVGMPDAEMGQRVCAYIVPKPTRRLDLNNISNFLKVQKVTPFLIPERVEILNAMPLLVTGHKIDRRWLEQDIAKKLDLEGADSQTKKA